MCWTALRRPSLPHRFCIALGENHKFTVRKAEVSEYGSVYEFYCSLIQAMEYAEFDPGWWGVFPMAVYSQTDRLDFGGKKVCVAVTHEGSGLGSCERQLRKKLKGVKFGKGLAIHGADAANSEAEVAKWAKEQVCA